MFFIWKVLLGFAFLGISLACSAQNIISGLVIDKASSQPIAGVQVYLDGTSFYTRTDDNGHFDLRVSKHVTANLVFTHVSYDPLVTPIPTDKGRKGYFMVAAVKSIPTVTVAAKKAHRPEIRHLSDKNLMKAFKCHFLGTTDAGQDCTILNEDEIELFYDKYTGALTARPNTIVRFENNYLGYYVEFLLAGFEANYAPGSTDLSPEQCTRSALYGTSFFREKEKVSGRALANRRQVYSESPMYLFKQLLYNAAYNTDYTFYDRERRILNLDYVFRVTDTVENNKVLSVNSDFVYPPEERAPYDDVCFYLYVDKNNGIESSCIYFRKPELLFTGYGLVIDPYAIFYSGNMSRQKTGDMLPLDYYVENY